MPSANPPPPWPTLWPLRQSYAENPVEDQLRQMLVSLFDMHIAALADDANVLGMAHLGSEALIARIMQVDGLALPNRGNPLIYAYLYRAWKGRNSGRGLHFLRMVLQLFFPGQWTVEQLTQAKAELYPTALGPRGTDEDPTRYLTSRLSISVSAESENGITLAALSPILRATLPARFVPRFQIEAIGDTGIRAASIGSSVIIVRANGNRIDGSVQAAIASIGAATLFIHTIGITT